MGSCLRHYAYCKIVAVKMVSDIFWGTTFSVMGRKSMPEKIRKIKTKKLLTPG